MNSNPSPEPDSSTTNRDCPDVGRLDRFITGALDDVDSARLADHIGRCPQCRELLDEIRANLEVAADFFVATRVPSAAPSAEVFEIPGCRFEKVVGRGSQGTVHRGTQLSTGRTVAIKILHAAPGSNTASKRRFEREVHLAARLKHPAVVAVFDGGIIESGARYLVMEWIDGDRLDRSIVEEKMSPREVAQIIKLVADGLHHAHTRGVLHRDLKPANILLDRDGTPHIVDFGIARGIDEDTDATELTAAGEFVGTVAYAAPEQLSGRSDAIDVRTDVYGLGATLFASLTGRPPHVVAGNLQATIKAIAENDPPRASSIAPRIDPDLDAVLAKALAKDPNRRYQTAAELANDLSNYLDGRPLAARSGERLHALERLLRRNRIVLGTTTVIVVALSTATYVSWRARKDAEAALERSERQTERAEEIAGTLREAFRRPTGYVGGRDAKLIDFLDDWADRLEKVPPRFADSEVTLRIALGKTYAGLGMNEPSEAQLQRALARAEDAVDVPEEEILDARAQLLEFRTRDRRPAEARAILESIRADAERLLPAHGSIMTGIRMNEMLILIDEKRYDAALALAEKVEKETPTDSPDHDRIRVRVKIARMTILRESRRDHELFAAARDFCDFLGKSIPAEPIVVIGMADAARVLAFAGDLVNGVRLADDAVTKAEKLFRPTEAAMLEILYKAGEVAYRAGDRSQARSRLEKFLSGHVVEPLPGASYVVYAGRMLGNILSEAKEYDAAIVALKLSADLSETSTEFGADGNLDIRRLEARSHAEMGRIKEAAEVLEKGLAIAVRSLPPSDPILLRARALQVGYRTRLDQLEEAAREIEKILESDDAALKSTGASRGTWLGRLEKVLDDDDRVAEAKSVRARIVELKSAASQPSAPPNHE